MGKAEVKQPKKLYGCIVARKSPKGDGAKAFCLGETLNLFRAKKIYSIREENPHKKSPLDTRQFYWREENPKFAFGEFESFPNNSSLLKSGYEFS